MKRRVVLKTFAQAACIAPWPLSSMAAPEPFKRVRPGDAAWPSEAQWRKLGATLGARLIKLSSAMACASGDTCAELRRKMRNPFYVGDDPALTQTSGWVDAWSSQPSAYAVVAESAADVAAAVNFARAHRLRLVVKGGGHSYLGTSDAPDSLLIWTRHLNGVTVHDAFVAQGSADAPQPAVSVQAGAMWTDAYNAVTTQAGRYVQGGGCTTVGVAGLVQSGGFGSFSKAYGTAAAGLLEAEIVTADGELRVVNAKQHPELFWALKGGGGGSFGVVTRLTLRTRELPQIFGAVFGSIQASTDEAYRALIARIIGFYASALFNPHWGEQIKFEGEKEVGLALVFQGLSKEEAEAVWAPFIEWVKARPDDYKVLKPIQALALPARHFWDVEFMRKYAPPGVMVSDERPGAPTHHAAWGGDLGQVGWFIHGYQSAWLPQSLLQADQQAKLVDALYECKRDWDVALHLNKGLAGAPSADIASARNTATNPQVLEAFALAIVAGGGGPAYPGQGGEGPDLGRARKRAAAIERAMKSLRRAAPGAGAYVSESDYFQPDWQAAYWGTNYPRLLAAKLRYDPEGLFFVHHGVGSEGWSEDGFVRIS